MSWTTPGAGPVRVRVENASRGPLVWLHDLPRVVLFLVLTALVVAGALLPGRPGAVVLLVIAALVGWLMYLAWPGLGASQRAVRVVLLVLVLGAAVARAVTA